MPLKSARPKTIKWRKILGESQRLLATRRLRRKNTNLMTALCWADRICCTFPPQAATRPGVPQLQKVFFGFFSLSSALDGATCAVIQWRHESHYKYHRDTTVMNWLLLKTAKARGEEKLQISEPRFTLHLIIPCVQRLEDSMEKKTNIQGEGKSLLIILASLVMDRRSFGYTCVWFATMRRGALSRSFMFSCFCANQLSVVFSLL